MENEQKIKKYELMLLFSGQLSDSEIEKALDQVKAIITEKGGDVFYEDKWGRRDLAYRVKKENSGYYVVLNFNLAPEYLKEVDQSLHLDQLVLRHLLTQVASGYQVQRFDTEPEKLIQEEKKETLPKKETEEIEEKAPEVREEEPEEPATEEVKVKPKKQEKKKEPKETQAEEKEKLNAVEEKLRDIISDKDLNL